MLPLQTVMYNNLVHTRKQTTMLPSE